MSPGRPDRVSNEPRWRNLERRAILAAERCARRGRPFRDDDLESAFPEVASHFAVEFWSPLGVAKRAAELLVQDQRERTFRILDVGAGLGKFCAVGSLNTPALFTGVEHREHLVELGNSVLSQLGLERARLEHGTLADIPWSDFDAFYLFNPFEENFFPDTRCIDGTVPLCGDRFQSDVEIVEAALHRAPVGTRVATYFGFGGRIPLSYQLVHSEARRGGALRLWVKTSATSSRHEGLLEALLPVP